MEWPSDLSSSAGCVSLRWRPSFDFGDHASDERLLDVDGDAFSIDWQGAAGHGSDKEAIVLINDGEVIARWWPQHAAGEMLRIEVHYGGSVRPHLFVNGVGVLASADWVPPTIGATVETPENLGPLHGVHMMDRRPSIRLVAALGDSLSVEWYNSDPERAPVGHVKSWPRFAGSRRRHPSTYFLQAGVGGDQLAGMLARAEADVVEAGASECVLLGGLNDVKANRTLVQLQTDAGGIIDLLQAAGIRVTAVEVLPFSGSSAWSAPREVVRVGFNAWLRNDRRLRGGRGRILRLASCMADPADATLLLDEYDISDGEHPSAAGAERLGRGIAGRL